MSVSRLKLLLAVVLVSAFGCAILLSAPSGRYTFSHRSAYVSPEREAFAGAGLIIKVTGADIGSDGTIRARVKLTDAAGRPLDREGIQTPGRVSVSLIPAYIPRGKSQYITYTTRSVTSPITNSTAVQATGENTGTWSKTADGEYQYTFALKPANVDRGVTHSIGAYGSRNLSEIDMGTYYSDSVYNFVPDGSKVTVVRDVIKTASCNGCHYSMGFHGGSRKSVELCILCHQPQSTDPDTGNTVDMPVMVHKIHMGSSLPSVKAGKHYVIIGNSQSVHDYSDVAFPADARSCLVCHRQDQLAATQADNVFKPTRAACGACHDNVNFATGENHVDLPQFSDNLCETCHIKQGEVDFDASVMGAHTIPTESRLLGGVVLAIKDVTGAAPGKNLTVTFTVFDKSGKPLAPSQLSRLNFRLNGPANDYKTVISEDALKAQGSNGFYFWTFLNPLPADAKGTWGLSLEGRRDVTLLQGTKKEVAAVRDTAKNSSFFFSVDGSKVQPRRTIVSLAKCNACHGTLGLHGGARNTVENCPLCHTASLTAGTGAAAVPLDFPMLVHRIHSGRELTRPYKIGNTSFNDVGYPGNLRNCAACHVNGSENPPMMHGLSAVADPAGPLQPLLPTAAACTGCHDTAEAAAHADANTTKLGESCGVCHGSSSEFSVSRVHSN